ncbi:flagellar basal body L-ring protein FlgH [Acidithiobacillus sp.]|jgi:flagellar L-ring protein precursor FlgH|nr:flagellar basal body L-ring protein FlgH [Acidithiobacillus sp.]MCK9187589.1 flagellar basal body L-ring protein FlgH [Acidithiobacillus sp.]
MMILGGLNGLLSNGWRGFARVVMVVGCLFSLGACATLKGHRDLKPLTPLPIPAKPESLAAHPANGAIWQTGTNVSLFNDNRANRIGDLITVLIQENSSASNNTNTAINTSDSLNAALTNFFGITPAFGSVAGSPFSPSMGATSGQKYGGTGATTQSNTFTAMLEVTVVRVQGNGNLVIEGSKEVLLNGGHEYIRVAGIVRPADVTPQNTILSTQIADARVEYSGDGSIYSAARMPWLARFFLSLWPF